ncbi:tetratricopeptide repeat protein [Ralstonia insidiosa]|uniref:tetratricopeptide repeat protein n=1 Tax=Ralstonia insidiosa TaxID=190721 RepID=UPI001ABF4B91|nr:tetratricopeptide repeat protein [Ralstonia insidiosa]
MHHATIDRYAAGRGEVNSALDAQPQPPTFMQDAITQALNAALARHRTGDLGAAETAYRTILAAHHNDPDATYFLGLLLHQTGRSDDGMALVERALHLQPDRPERYNELGNARVQRGELTQAAEAFIHALELKADDKLIWNNLGATMLALGMADDAATAFQNAIALDADFADALEHYANLLSARGQTQEAALYHCRAILARPEIDQPEQLRRVALYRLGRHAEAAEIYRRWLEREPDNPIARHFLAACAGTDTPPRCADAFVEQTFDDAAPQFDQKLTGLRYRGPEYVGDALRQLALPQGSLDVLDAGCGTGLCAPHLVPVARTLTGVDLSAGMLALAQAAGLYHQLVKAELGEYLGTHPTQWDLIVVADTLVYFGGLEHIASAMAAALRPAGHAILTFEALDTSSDGTDYVLQPSGRYAHKLAYIERCLADAGFTGITSRSAPIRHEFDREIAGWVVVAELPRWDLAASVGTRP